MGDLARVVNTLYLYLLPHNEDECFSIMDSLLERVGARFSTPPPTIVAQVNAMLDELTEGRLDYPASGPDQA